MCGGSEGGSAAKKHGTQVNLLTERAGPLSRLVQLLRGIRPRHHLSLVVHMGTRSVCVFLFCIADNQLGGPALSHWPWTQQQKVILFCFEAICNHKPSLLKLNGENELYAFFLDIISDTRFILPVALLPPQLREKVGLVVL